MIVRVDPLTVAVALGLLNHSVLEEEKDVITMVGKKTSTVPSDSSVLPRIKNLRGGRAFFERGRRTL
jgi:hypothetical protein